MHEGLRQARLANPGPPLGVRPARCPSGRVLASLRAVLAVGLVLTGTAQAELATRSFTNSALGSDPQTAALELSGWPPTGTLTIDLSAIQGATVYRATLDPYQRPQFHHDRMPGYFIDETSLAQYDLRTPWGVPLELRPPRFLTLDATAAVQEAIASGTLILTVHDVGPGFGPSVSLDVLCNAPAPTPIAQVNGAAARHADGTTLITFAEVDPPHLGETWTVGQFTAALLSQYMHDLSPKVRYRIYRGYEPLTTPAAVAQAELIDEILPLSGWNFPLPSIHAPDDTPIPMLPVEHMTLAEPGTGIYAHQPLQAEPDSVYYLVSRAFNGAEDFSYLAPGVNATTGVAESPGPGLALRWEEEAFPDGWWWSPDRHPLFHTYVRWECPPRWNLPSRPCNYRVGIPEGAVGPGPGREAGPGILTGAAPGVRDEERPLAIEPHAWGGNLYGWRTWRNYDDGALLLTANLVRYNSYSAFNECMETLRPWDEGTAQPYHWARVLSFIFDFVAPAYGFDASRITMSGGSMGGAAGHFWGMRSGHLVTYIIAAVGNQIPAEDITWEFEHMGGYGPLGWDLDYSNEQLARFGYPVVAPEDEISVWDHFDNEQWLAEYPERETPYLSHANAPNDGIGWEQVWKVVQALIATRRPMNFSWGQQGHGQPAEELELPFHLDRSIPGFTQCSLDDDLGNEPWGCDDEGQINRYLRWDPETVLDLPARWAMDLRLNDEAPADTCTVDVTPWRLQHLLHGPEMQFLWRLEEAGFTVAEGTAIADEHGRVTMAGVPLGRTVRRLVLEREDAAGIDTQDPSTRRGVIRLQRVHPNPAHAGGAIHFDIATGAARGTRLAVFDPAGRLVRTLYAGRSEEASNHTLVWDMRDQTGRRLAAGVYWVCLQGGGKSEARRLVVVR